MDIRVVTLFPELVSGALAHGITGRALERGLARLETVNPRDFAHDPHKTVDDRPYGGGPGMVLKVAPFRAAIRRARAGLEADSPVIFLTPQGRRFDQATARRLAARGGMILVAGRYEGFDQRLILAEADEELSLGDFVLSGGEIAALAVADAVIRLLPGALGDETSAAEDSFVDGLLDCPHYTRPEHFEGMNVPPVLLEGNHAEIRRWRLKQSLGRTCLRRPDLLAQRPLSEDEKVLLQEYLAEHGAAASGGRLWRH